MKKLVTVFGLWAVMLAPMAFAEGESVNIVDDGNGVSIVDDGGEVVLTDEPTPVPIMEAGDVLTEEPIVTDAVAVTTQESGYGSILNWAGIIVSILLVLFILTQERGGGLSSTFGGSGGFYASKRGMEKTLYRGTVILALLFAIVNLMAMWV